jgi:3-hydroxybutyryl-CoA dehydrogenase
MKLEIIDNVAIIGTGMIGASMAVLFTGNGYKTTVYAIDDVEAAKGRAIYDTYYRDLIENKLVNAAQAAKCANLVKFTQKFEDVALADFIFECVVERLDIKHSVYKQVERHCKKFKAIASSTSAITVDDLAEGLLQKDKLSVAHPYNPPHLVPCVEVLKGTHTSDEAVGLVVDVLESLGREVIQMKKGAPGFVANRLQHALFREAVYMVEQGIAAPADIDRTLRSSFIPRYTQIGLFEHFDYAGLDMITSIGDYLFPTLCNADKTQEYIRSRVKSGNLGFKTGTGVYDWSKIDGADFRKRASRPYLQFFNWSVPD